MVFSLMLSGLSLAAAPALVMAHDEKPAQSFRHEKRITAFLAFSPDGKTLATATDDKRIHLWDVSSGKEKSILRSDKAVFQLRFLPDGKTLIAASDAGIDLWDVMAEKRQTTFAEGAFLGLSSDGRAYFTQGPFFVVFRREITTGKETVRYRGHTESVSRGMAMTPDGKTLVTAEAGRIRLWDAITGDPRSASYLGLIYGISISPDGKRLVYAGGKQVRLIEMETTKEIWCYSDEHRLYSVAFCGEGRMVAAGTDGGVRLLDSASGKLLRTLRTDSDGPLFVTSSPDGKNIAVFNDDHTVWLWSVR
jgi:WD40 repeat protein